MYYVYSIDATAEDGRMGRLANHSRKGTAKMRVVLVDSLPRLCLFATADMSHSQQVLYDYGIKNLPFEDKVCHIECQYVNTDIK